MRIVAVILALVLHGAGRAEETVRLTAVRDTSIVLLDSEEAQCQGGLPRIRIKGDQHIVAMGFDASGLAGRRILRAELVCRRVYAEIQAVTIATISAPWEEASANCLTAGVAGVSGWGVPGARFPSVSLGNGGSLTCQAASVVREGWYHWPVDPKLVQALALGLAHGLAIQEVDVDYSRNPTIAAREQSAEAPYLLVTIAQAGEADLPEAPSGCALDAADPDQVWLTLTAPANALAFAVRVGATELPRWNIPFALPGRRQAIAIRDLPLPAGAISVSVTALDGLGRRSRTVAISGTIPERRDPPTCEPGPLAQRPSAVTGLVAIPLLDRYDDTGRAIGDLPSDHRTCNEVFDGESILLDAARGEVVGFQTRITGQGEVALTVEVPGCRCDVFRAVYVASPSGRVPDPLLRCASLALSDEPTPIVCETFVPFDAHTGDVLRSFALSDGRRLPIRLRVRAITLPKRASFLCEMNGYGMPDRLDTFYRLQQVAYDHRVHANILHYSHRTAAPGARKCNLDMLLPSGRRMDEARYDAIAPGEQHAYWDDFIAAFGPYLSGSCFASGHRGAIPAPGFYLTFHESWPLSVRAYFNGDPDAFHAFDDAEYADTFVAIMRDFIRVAQREGWTGTGFQVFCNNKGALTDPERSPWVMDEPASWWDYRALAFYGGLVRRAKGDACPIRLDDRIDISRPEFTRGTLDGVADLWVVAQGPYARYRRLVQDHARRFAERIWVYGSSNAVDRSNRETEAWVLAAFRDGATGVVPWQTIVGADALTTGDTLGIFILDPHGNEVAVHHSLRLDAYCRAEQDVEYLCLLRDRLGLTPGQLARFIDRYLDLSVTHARASEDDAGAARFQAATPDGFRRLRTAAAQLIEAADNP